MSKRHEIRVIYKSGAEVTFTCDSLTVPRSALGGLAAIKWEKAEPDPLFAGVDDIAAVWQLS